MVRDVKTSKENRRLEYYRFMEIHANNVLIYTTQITINTHIIKTLIAICIDNKYNLNKYVAAI